MKLKRLLSIVLSLIIVFGALSGLSFANEETAQVYGSDSIGMLKALELVDFSEDQLGESITRADFLKLIGIAAGYGETKSAEEVFSDLPLDDAREPYVKALYNVGIISLKNDKKVYPDAEISLIEAAAIAVKVTGYSLVAESRGGYPNGYYHVAKKNGLLDGLPASQYAVLTKGMAAKLIDNTLKADLMVQTGFGSDNEFEEINGKNLLNAYHGVYFIDDVVNGVDVSRLTGENDVETFYSVIGDMEIETMNVENMHDLLGYRVNAYYKHERADIPRLVYIEKSVKNKETVLNIEDISSIKSGKIKAYDEKSKLKTYSFKRTLPVIYNTVSTKQPLSMSLISGKLGKVTLLDNTGDNSADVILVDAYVNYVVAHVDVDNNTIYDKYSTSKTKVLDVTTDNPYTNIYNAKGKSINIGGISAGDVVSVFESADDSYQKYINAYVIGKSVAGIIERSYDNGNRIVISGVEYEVSPECKAKFGTDKPGDTSIANILKNGKGVKIYLDYNDRVVWAEKSATTDLKYGFVVAHDAASGLIANLKIKVYTANGVFEVIEVADNVKIDGVSYKNNFDGVISKLNAASIAMFGTEVPNGCISSLVKYALNSEGKIAYIDTALNNKTNALAAREDFSDELDSIFYTTGTQVTCRTPDRLGHQILYASATPVIAFPDPSVKVDGKYKYDVNDEDCYYVTNAKAEFVSEREYDVKAFYGDNRQFVVEMIGLLYGSKYDITYTDNMGVVSQEVSQMYDEANEEVIDYIVVNGDTEIYAAPNFTIEYPTNLTNVYINAVADADAKANPANYLPTKLSEIKKGDVVKYKLDRNGRLENLQFIFRDSESTYVQYYNMVDDDPFSYRAMRFGYVIDKYDGGAIVYFPGTYADFYNFDPKNLANVEYSKCDILTTSNTPTLLSYEQIKDNGDMGVEYILYDDLKAYKHVGENCSKVMVQQYYGRVRVLVNF